MAGPMVGGAVATPFDRYVAQHTGLDLAVVDAWMRAEGGPADNPLNIQHSGTVQHYGSTYNAAKATVKVLNQPNMAPILRAAKSGSANAQLAAIVASPWAGDHYTAKTPGDKLRGAYETVTKTGSTGLGGSKAGTAGLGIPLPHIPNPLDAVSGAESWLAKEGTVALLYVGFTALAIVLVVLGGGKLSGVSVPGLVASRGAKAAAAGEIPF